MERLYYTSMKQNVFFSNIKIVKKKKNEISLVIKRTTKEVAERKVFIKSKKTKN